MKPFLFLLLLFSFSGPKAQQKNKVDSNKAGEVTTSNGNFENEQVDSVFTGKILTDKSNRSRIYLTGFKQTVDSNGNYTTTYIFGAKISRPAFDINIRMNFQNPLLPFGGLGFEYGPYGVGRYSGSGGLRNNNLYLFLQGQITSSNHHFYIKVKSKQKLSPVISGIDGQSNF